MLDFLQREEIVDLFCFVRNWRRGLCCAVIPMGDYDEGDYEFFLIARFWFLVGKGIFRHL